MARGDFIHSDSDVSLVARREGFTATVRDELSITNVRGVAWFNNDLYTGNSGGDIRRHSGFDSTIQETVTIGGADNAFTFTNYGDLISNPRTNSIVTMYQGFSTIPVAVITVANPVTGTEWGHGEREQNLLTADNTNQNMHRYVGFTSTVKDTIDPSVVAPRGPAWSDEYDAAVTDANDVPNTNKLLFGWSNTIKTTFTETGWNGAQQQTFEKVYPVIRQSMT